MNPILDETKNYYRHDRTEMLKYIPDNVRTILDVGCGEGLFGRAIKQERNCEVWGVELNSLATEKAQNNINKAINGDIVLILDSLPDQYFDCIVFNDVLEHLIDPYSLLLKMKNILSKDGVIVCSIPNIRYFRAFIDFLISKEWKYTDDGVFDRTHLRFFTYKSIINMFNSLDYDILKIEGLVPIQSWEFKLFELVSIGYLSDMRYSQYVCIVKPKSAIRPSE
jgi:2-polyprenyl-3-methyl-5-hydroxy-6-metoxy-1,4-benzoquinol methylase